MREWKKGVSSYRGIIIVSKESGISELSNLRGRKIAFEDPGSTSGFLLPYAALVNGGLTLRRVTSPRSTVATGEIGYVFAEEELNIAGWVVRGIVAAGAMSEVCRQAEAMTMDGQPNDGLGDVVDRVGKEFERVKQVLTTIVPDVPRGLDRGISC